MPPKIATVPSHFSACADTCVLSAACGVTARTTPILSALKAAGTKTATPPSATACATSAPLNQAASAASTSVDPICDRIRRHSIALSLERPDSNTEPILRHVVANAIKARLAKLTIIAKVKPHSLHRSNPTRREREKGRRRRPIIAA